jgi:hypothetical protein
MNHTQPGDTQTLHHARHATSRYRFDATMLR